MNCREPTDSPFREISNLCTPKPNPKCPRPLLFTTSKTSLPAPTPTTLGHRRALAGAATPTPLSGAVSPTPLDRRLRALELDQSRSARRAESGRDRALRTFASSASSWLSLLLRDPSACGCPPAASLTVTTTPASAVGKRTAPDCQRARSPKRHRGGDRYMGRSKTMTPAMASALRESLREVCSLEDATERMGRYMSTEACEEVLVMMSQICKNIDESRLKMKASCPLATDLRMKENATRIFMCYNPEWLRIGLHIVLGGDSLLQNASRKQDKEVPFLKRILEKQLFAQNATAKTSFHNKLGPDYTEALSNIMLKRIFMLVAALDRAKLESTLPLTSGIDSLDGGSPLLFCPQAQIKSSQQIIQMALGEAMHGEGDLLVHLLTMGYKLNYQQLALSEYDFNIRNLFEDLQDGIILCRVVQLLLSDASIILKVIAPSHTRKKKLHNCKTAIQYIKQAGVPISDVDGVTISEEDIASGDKEMILSLLWEVFIHIQLPLLANRTSLARALSNLQEPILEQPIFETKSHFGLLCNWIQVICAKYGIHVGNSSQIDRGALNYFISYYLNVSIHTDPLKETYSDCRKELFSSHDLDTLTDSTSYASSNIGKVFADCLQDIPASGILADDILFDEKSAIVLIGFLSSRLTNAKILEELRNLINKRLDYQSSEKVSGRRRSPGKNDMKYQPPRTDDSCISQEWAATIIQTQARRIIAKNKYHKLTEAISILQGAMRAWSAVILKSKSSHPTLAISTTRKAYGNYNKYFILISERHSFVEMRRAAIVIQQAVRIWIRERKRQKNIEEFWKSAMAARKIQVAYRKLLHNRSSRMSAAIKIQSHWRGYAIRICFAKQVQAIIAIQAAIRRILCFQAFERQRHAAIVIQRFARGSLSRKRLIGSSSLKANASLCALNQGQHKKSQQSIELKIVVNSVLRLQRWWRKVRLHQSLRTSAIKIQSFIRGWLARKQVNQYIFCVCLVQRRWRKFLLLESRKKAAVVIQSNVRGWIARQDAIRKKRCITIIQSFVKAYIVRKASKQEVSDLRSRLQISSAKVDDGMRLINRLIAALSQLTHCSSISSIRQTCTTLSIATEFSENCCQTLVGAGAVDILLSKIPLLNRGVPAQEVKKQLFLTLRNIARFPNLRPALANTPRSIEIIFQELLRSKGEGFFVACDILKKLCESKEGREIAGSLQQHIRRLGNLVQDLKQKVEHDKRNCRMEARKENNLRQLGEATTLYNILTNERGC